MKLFNKKKLSDAQKKFNPDTIINALPKKQRIIALRGAINKLEAMTLNYKHQLKDLEDEQKRLD